MKQVLALILVAALALLLVACGETGGTPAGNNGNNGGGTVATTQAGGNGGNGTANAGQVNSIKDAYYFFNDNVIEAMEKSIGDATETWTAQHEDDPFSLIYLPFTSLSVIDAVYFDDDLTEDEIKLSVSFLHEDAAVTKTADGYELTYTGKDYNDESKTYAMKEVFKADLSSNLKFSFEQYEDGKITEFLECVSLGGGKYALMNESNRAIVTIEDGKATEILHAANIHDTDWETDELSPASVLNRYPEESIYNKTGLDRAWVTEHESENAIERLYDYSGNTLKITGMNKDYNLDTGFYDYTPGFEKVLTF